MSLPLLPGSLDHAVASWLQNQSGAQLREKSGALIEAYRRGQSSGHIDLAAYLTTRMPATFAAVSRVLAEVAHVMPSFAPASLLDVGAGPGTASWAALAEWPQLASIAMVEQDPRFTELAAAFAQHSELPALAAAKINRSSMAANDAKAELVIAAYVFAELAEYDAAKAALKLWTQAEHTLVIIEPGTPRGAARIRAARAALIAEGAHVIGPCTHANACPMAGADWCHFVVRLARSREHMHAKQATAPFEDENFSWIAVSRQEATLPEARIVKPEQMEKHSLTLKVCDAGGLSTRVIARRDKAAYKMHRKLKWGDTLPPKSAQESE